MTTDFPLSELFEICSNRIRAIFNQYLTDIPSLELKKAMEYTLFNHGKHLRPVLIYATGCVFDAQWDNLDIPASSVELIHTYSLIHDDLPCMDDADFRRGKPSCHKAYDEGLAVLTGDALHTLAVQIMASHPAPMKDTKRIQLTKILTAACGPYGMASGQALDITLLNDPKISPELLYEIYQLKTGALIKACLEMGFICSDNNDEIHLNALRHFGEKIGLAFQIQDDILDMEIETNALGKPQGLDNKNKKNTYPQIFGLQNAKEKVHSLHEAALEAINYLGSKAQLLRDLADYILERKR